MMEKIKTDYTQRPLKIYAKLFKIPKLTFVLKLRNLLLMFFTVQSC